MKSDYSLKEVVGGMLYNCSKHIDFLFYQDIWWVRIGHFLIFSRLLCRIVYLESARLERNRRNVIYN
jgi:hypothetical protein